MFLAIIIPPARKSKVAALVAISFALSFVCTYLPGISALRWHLHHSCLTVAISCAAAILFPVKARGGQTNEQLIYIAVMFAVSYAIRILPLINSSASPLKTSSSNRSCTTSPVTLSHWPVMHHPVPAAVIVNAIAQSPVVQVSVACCCVVCAGTVLVH